MGVDIAMARKRILAPSSDNQTWNYDIECWNQHPSLLTLMPKWLGRSKMKWWAIYTNLPMDVIFRLPHIRSGDSHGQETFLAPSADKQTRNYDIECWNHYPSLLTPRPKWLSRSKMKWGAISTNLPMDVIVRLPDPWSGDSHDKETYLAPSADNQTWNYDIECSNHHPLLSTLSPNGFSHRKRKWLATHTNIPVHVMIRLTHPRSRESQKHETFLAPSADKKTCSYDIECSNHHHSLSILRPKGLSRSKMKWWAIYANLPVGVIVRLPHRGSGDTKYQEAFLAPSPDKQTRNYNKECSNHHPSPSTLTPKGLSRSKMKWWAIKRNIPVGVIVRLPHRRSGDNQYQEAFLAPSADKQTRNYDIECSNHHSSLSTIRPKGLSHSKMKWWLTYTNIPVDVTFRLPRPCSGDRKNQETFLAPSADKQTRNYNIEC